MDKEQKQQLIIVDATYLCHYCAYSTHGLSFKGKETGVIFSFLRQVLLIGKKFRSRRFVFAWDSDRSVRKLIYPPYKSNRPKPPVAGSPEKKSGELEIEAYQQFSELQKKVLPRLGFRNSFHQRGYEADDIIAKISTHEGFMNGERMIIVGADNDLYQLLDSMTSMYKPRDKKLYTSADFKTEWGIEPYMWSSVKSIAGCPGDNVEGVRGVGEKTAIKYMKGELRGDSRLAILIRESKNMIDRNSRLVSLPFPDTRECELDRDECFYTNDYFDVIAEYGLASFGSDKTLSDWRELFDMRSRLPDSRRDL